MMAIPIRAAQNLIFDDIFNALDPRLTGNDEQLTKTGGLLLVQILEQVARSRFVQLIIDLILTLKLFRFFDSNKNFEKPI